MFNPSYLHPMIVHFPIALILAGFLADLLYLFYKKQPAPFLLPFCYENTSLLGAAGDLQQVVPELGLDRT